MEKEPGRRSARLGLRAMYSAPRATPSGSQRSKRDGKTANAARLIASKSRCGSRCDLAAALAADTCASIFGGAAALPAGDPGVDVGNVIDDQPRAALAVGWTISAQPPFRERAFAGSRY